MTYFLANVSIPAETKYNEKLKDTVTNFSVAENYRDRSGKEHVEYYRMAIYGKRGASLAPYLTTGRCMLVTGRVKPGAYIAQKGEKKGEAVGYLKMNNARIQFAGGAGKPTDPTVDIPEEIDVDEVEITVEDGTLE